MCFLNGCVNVAKPAAIWTDRLFYFILWLLFIISDYKVYSLINSLF
jgi:hypothetical protein